MSQAANCTATCPKVQVLLGSNVTSEISTNARMIRDALNSLAHHNQRIVQISNYYSTACFPVGAGPDFANVAAEIETDLAPEELLAVLHEVEAEFGRVRNARWAQRSLDIDLIAYGDLIAPNEERLRHWMGLPLERQMKEAPDQLILPHPRLQDRAFALIPLADIAPDWRHPVIGKTIAQMVAALSEAEKSEVIRMEEP